MQFFLLAGVLLIAAVVGNLLTKKYPKLLGAVWFILPVCCVGVGIYGIVVVIGALQSLEGK